MKLPHKKAVSPQDQGDKHSEEKHQPRTDAKELYLG